MLLSIIYALRVIYVYCTCVVELLCNYVLLCISSQLHVQ